MSKKDYIALAAALRLIKPLVGRSVVSHARQDQWRDDCFAVAGVLGNSSNRFDRGRFLEACGMPMSASGWNES